MDGFEAPRKNAMETNLFCLLNSDSSPYMCFRLLLRIGRPVVLVHQACSNIIILILDYFFSELLLFVAFEGFHIDSCSLSSEHAGVKKK